MTPAQRVCHKISAPLKVGYFGLQWPDADDWLRLHGIYLKRTAAALFGFVHVTS
jgi:hypothetical protein